MSTDPDQIRAHIHALLTELPDSGSDAAGLVDADLDDLARRLEEAHDVLVRALESVEKG